ncbi:Uncharacterized protein LARI1_G000550 [Lachnellula arida]|uniref:Uncharacterized protein n=2 Tax=Lachnellula TaxID=47830 RepID=A0A7D8YTG7_9HELO|nr:Uncharacterized protein LARI1_G000550 [Lachnellula arida]TVY59069.1 Uncharacterized protein LCER1_G000367 [Lachnellula cervina]
MSSFYHYNHQQHSAANAQSASSHHSGRGRRAPRLAAHKPFRNVRKEEEAAVVTNFRQRFESGRSFDLDDDMEFCPNLLTETDMVSISSSSDRSSLSSGSPESSPQSHQVTPDSHFSLNSNSNPYISSYQSQPTPLKLHQPSATRIRNAIPIVNPSTRGINLSSPPQSVSPARMQGQTIGRRW